MILFVLVLLFVLIAFLFCEMNVIFYFIQNSLCFIIWLRSLMLFQFIRSLMSFLFLKMRFVKLVYGIHTFDQKSEMTTMEAAVGCSSNDKDFVPDNLATLRVLRDHEKKHELANERTRARWGHGRTKHKQTLQFISYIIVCSSDDKDFVLEDVAAERYVNLKKQPGRANKSSLSSRANKI